MSKNKYGDKVNAITPPTPEKKKEEKVEEKVEVAQPMTAKTQDEITRPEPPRPNSNFSRTLEDTKPNTDFKVGDRVKLEMTEYVALMDKARNPEEMAKAQYKFFGIIKSILLQKEFTTFNKEWNSLLNFINVNKDHINLITINRAIYLWPMTRKEQNIHSKMAFLAVMSADMKTRRKPNNIDGNDVISLAEQLGKEAAYNLGAFYNFD